MPLVFGKLEAAFDLLYLLAAAALSVALLITRGGRPAGLLAGLMGLVLSGGDAFHLLPRVQVILAGENEARRRALGRGKQITSITMTLFYLLLWECGRALFRPDNLTLASFLVYALAGLRLLLCLLPQNRWLERQPPQAPAVWRNLPFAAQGLLVALLFYRYRSLEPTLGRMWLAIGLSFLFYLPVVFLAQKHPPVGILMLPKTVTYLWMLVLCFTIPVP